MHLENSYGIYYFFPLTEYLVVYSEEFQPAVLWLCMPQSVCWSFAGLSGKFTAKPPLTAAECFSFKSRAGNLHHWISILCNARSTFQCS